MALGGRFILGAAIAVALPEVAIAATPGRPGGATDVQPACMMVTRPVPFSSVPGRKDVVAAPCNGIAPARPFAYDASVQGMRTVRPLIVGETIAAIPRFALPAVRVGDQVVLSTKVGAITVERQVVALQAGHEGSPFFVRGGDGSVFVASPRDVKP